MAKRNVSRRQVSRREAAATSNDRVSRVLTRSMNRLRRVGKKRSGTEMKAAYRDAADAIESLIK